MMKTTKWFTFEEVLNLYSAIAPTPNGVPGDTQHENWLLTMLSAEELQLRYAGINLNGTRIKEADVKDAIAQVSNIVFDRQHHNYIYKIEEDRDLTSDDFAPAMNKFINVMNLTLPKYLPMFYEAKQLYENALKQLESESESFSRYNDTPQNEQDNVDFNSEAYATNMGKNKSVTKVDSGSPVARIDELRTKWKAIILEWANNFDMIFIDEYQLGDF